MGSLPNSSLRVSEQAVQQASGDRLIAILAPSRTKADMTPRLMGGADQAYGEHGYGPGVEYAAYHVAKTGLPFLYIAMPIAVEGTLGRKSTAGHSGTSTVNIAASSGGVLFEHLGRIRVAVGGIVGVDPIVLEYSLDDGRNWKRFFLGVATSWALPYINALFSATAAGTLVAGDTILTWSATGPRASSGDLTTVREKLAESEDMFRTVLKTDDIYSASEGNAFRDMLDQYATQDKDYTRGRCSVRDRVPLAALSSARHNMTASTLTFADGAPDTLTRASGSWLADGFAVGDIVDVTGTASNDGSYLVTALTALVMTIDGLTAEVISTATVTGYAGIAFSGTSDTITRNTGSWSDDGFRVGDVVTVAGSASNNGAFTVTALTPLVMTVEADDLVDESISAEDVTISTGQTMTAWGAATFAEFAAVAGSFRLDVSLGRLKGISPWSGFDYRLPVSWWASFREYQHDLHVASWRKKDGPLGGSARDLDNLLDEWDDRIQGGAATNAGFTAAMSYTKQKGMYLAQSLTRTDDSSILSQSSKVDVANLICRVVQANTENAAIGVDVVLKDDGSGQATEASLSEIESLVNAALEGQVLTNVRGEGPRASSVVWKASRLDLYNVPTPLMNGVATVTFNGTIHSVNTVVAIQTGA